MQDNTNKWVLYFSNLYILIEFNGKVQTSCLDKKKQQMIPVPNIRVHNITTYVF